MLLSARTGKPQLLLPTLGGESLGKGGTHAACALPEAGDRQAADRLGGNNPLTVPAAARAGIVRLFIQPCWLLFKVQRDIGDRRMFRP
jgi:hypothetical protein